MYVYIKMHIYVYVHTCVLLFTYIIITIVKCNCPDTRLCLRRPQIERIYFHTYAHTHTCRAHANKYNGW